MLIVGSGRQAVAAGYDLCRFVPGARLTLVDRDFGQANLAVSRIRKALPEAAVEPWQDSADDFDAIVSLAQEHDAVLAGVPYHLNPLVHKAAGCAKVPSVDMGSDLPELEETLGPKNAYNRNVAVFDSGLAPGLGNQLAAMLIEEVEGVEAVKVLCGGLPLSPRSPFKYKPRFSLEGLVGEYSDPAAALRDGVVAELESLTDLETVEIEGLGSLEAFVTSGGSSIGPQLHQGQVRQYEYKTLRFPGHCQTMRDFRELGLWRPENIGLFARLFERATADEDEADQVILVVEAAGREHRRIVLRQCHDPATGLSAMEQLTGFSASIVLQQVLENPPKPGLYAAEEVVSGRSMLEELARRGITPQG